MRGCRASKPCLTATKANSQVHAGLACAMRRRKSLDSRPPSAHLPGCALGFDVLNARPGMSLSKVLAWVTDRPGTASVTGKRFKSSQLLALLWSAALLVDSVMLRF